jgi:hypothetical protein
MMIFFMLNSLEKRHTAVQHRAWTKVKNRSDCATQKKLRQHFAAFGEQRIDLGPLVFQ